MQQEDKPKTQLSWINLLRRNSWEMELLLTGFVLLGLIQLPDVIIERGEQFLVPYDGDGIVTFFVGAGALGLLTGIRVIIFNLIILLLLRGFWIGMIGLSSVFPEGIQFSKLRLNNRNIKQLKESAPESEDLILRVDNYCSLIFAFSFLLFFMAISLSLLITQILTIGLLPDLLELDWDHLSTKIFVAIIVTIIAIYIIGAILKVIDFLTVGAVKRIRFKWLAIPYYYLSQFITYTSLGFLYRPIYYIFVSNLPRRQVSFAFVFYMVLILVIFLGVNFPNDALYYPTQWRDEFELSFSEYENLRPSDFGTVDSYIIQSDVISGHYIRLFIPYLVTENWYYEELCPELTVIQESTFSNININVNGTSIFGESQIKRESVAKALDCFKSIYKIEIADSTYTDLTFLFHKYPQYEEPGILTHIPVGHLEPGFYELKIYQGERNPNRIQFWKE